MKIINKFENLSKKEQFDCRIKALRDILGYYGLGLTLHEALILCEGLIFTYSKMNFVGFPISDIPFAFATVSDVENNIFNALDINFCVEKIDDSDFGWSRMKWFVDNQKPLLVKIDGNYINRLAKSLEPTTQGIKVGHLSTVLLVGYQDEPENQYVAFTDFYKNGKPTPFELSRFQKCRGTVCFPYSPDFTCMHLAQNNKVCDVTVDKVNTSVICALKRITKKMLGETLFDGNIFSEEFSCHDIVHGIPAMKIMERDMKEMAQQYDLNDHRAKKILTLVAQLLRANLSLGGRSAFRNEFGKSLKECSIRFNDDIFDKIGDEFVAISGIWKKFIAALSKTSNLEKTYEGWANSIEGLAEIIHCEEIAFSKLHSVLSSVKYRNLAV